MAGEIRQFCSRSRIPPKLSKRIHPAFEEAAQPLATALEAPRIPAVREYAEQNERAERTTRAWT